MDTVLWKGNSRAIFGREGRMITSNILFESTVILLLLGKKFADNSKIEPENK
jgi:hypothetical protein